MTMNGFRYLTTCLLLFFGTVAFAAEPTHLGPRPGWLVNDMDDSPLKQQLLACQNKPSSQTDFSIGHRGAPLQFPEHTKESYVAAAQMGAGLIECDVAFTKDKELVCRHSQCDLHKTTNILATDLAQYCSKPFSPAAGGKASARCCTSDITLAQFKTLRGKMDAVNPKAETVKDYLDGTASWRTDLYASRGELMSHKESIELFKSLGVKMVPELKKPSVSMPFDGMSQEQLAQKLVDEYKAAGVTASSVFLQSFELTDIQYWIDKEPEFAKQAVFLDSRYRSGINPADPSTFKPDMKTLADSGVKIIAPPMWMLLGLDDSGKLKASAYATQARAAGLQIVAWTLERSGPLSGGGGWYYKSIAEAINNDGDMLTVLDALNTEVGVLGVFSDWPATVTYYANCAGK